MLENLIKELGQKELSPLHRTLLEKCKALVGLSRSSMSSYYDKWDEQERAYRAKVKSTKATSENDKSACKQGAPQSMSIPLTYSQIQTFVAFGMGLLQQRDRFYELEGTGEEDHKAAKLGEALLEQNLQYSDMNQKIYQFLLDIGRFSLGIIKHSWEVEKETVWVEQEVAPSAPVAFLGRMLPSLSATPKTEQVRVEQTRYQGNKLYSVSPYRFYPDPRLPLTRFQEGEFCASEDEFSRASLQKGQQSGTYAGVEHIENFKGDALEKRGNSRFIHVKADKSTTMMSRTTVSQNDTVIVTEVQLELVPSEFELSDGSKLGDSTTPEKWLVAYANDDRIIRVEPLGYEHNNFTYSVGQFSPDQHNFMNETIAEMIGTLQDVIDWFLNSHITNVRKHISNRMVVDPRGIFYEDLKNHKAVIRMRPEAAKKGVEHFIKQLNVSDVTRGHISDISELMKFAQMTTAISDNLMGQFHTGRRSAREASNVSQASGSRLRNVIKLLYSTAFEPLGKDMLSNLRSGLDEDTFVTVTGDEFPDWEAFNGFRINDDRIKIPVNRTTLKGKFDFKLFEGTLPSEKNSQADILSDILENILKNPQGMQIILSLGYDPGKLLKEVLELRGIKHPDRFKVDEIRLQQYQQELAQQQTQENGRLTQPDIGGPQSPGGQQQPLSPPSAGFTNFLGGAA